jgi:hypothetical protein
MEKRASVRTTTSAIFWLSAAFPIALAGGACGGQPQANDPAAPLTSTAAAGAGAVAAAPSAPAASSPVATTPAVTTPPPSAASPSTPATATPPPSAADPNTPAAPAAPVTPAAMTPAPLPAGTAPLSPYSLYDATTGTLNAPTPDQGVQIVTKEYDLAPGQEKFTCYHGQIDKQGEIDIKYWESKMAIGSHHFILYQADNDSEALGTMDESGCLTNFTNWIYSSAQPHIDLQIPEGVAMVLNSQQRINFDMHYINTGDQTLKVQVQLNAIFATGQFTKAASLISYNTGIRLQPHATGSASGDCTPGSGAKFFYMLTHTHRRGTLATISRVLANGQMGETLVESTNWDLPQEKKWITDPYMTFLPGEKFHYDCEYMNDLNQVVTTGPSAATNEMCMAITYYFPASAGGSCR